MATERAQTLAPSIAEILQRVRGVLSSAPPFDPATAARCFTLAMPDAVAAFLFPAFLAHVRKTSPQIDFRLRALLPPFDAVFAALDQRAIDLAIVPRAEAPARFNTRLLFEEPFVVAARRGHAYFRAPDLENYCEAKHLLVSVSGEAGGHVDEALLRLGKRRRVALTVPNFMLALALLAETDLLGAMPTRLVARHAARFKLSSAELPVSLPNTGLFAVTAQAALADDGMVWLSDALAAAAAESV